MLAGAVYEGLAADFDDADAKLADGRITLAATHDHGCVGSVAGIYTASMPVFVVENTARGNRAYCNFYEGESRHRLNYGSWNDEVRAGWTSSATSWPRCCGTSSARPAGSRSSR